MRVGERCWGHPYHPRNRSCHWLLQRIGRFNTRQRVICPSTTCMHPPWSGPLNGFISGTHFYCVCSNWSAAAGISVPERRAWASIVANAQNPPSFYQWLPKTIWHNDGDDDEEEESVNQQTLIVESGCCCWYRLQLKMSQISQWNTTNWHSRDPSFPLIAECGKHCKEMWIRIHICFKNYSYEN